MIKRLLLDCADVTEKAAIAASALKGMGDEKAADQLAVDAMRAALNQLDIQGRIVIGEGERDKAPMLFIGEQVGTGSGVEVDIAVDPLEGTTILANGAANALSVMAVAPKRGLLHAPDLYMDKIAIGFDFKERIIDLNNSPKENLQNIAKAKNCDISSLSVVVLKRPRHEELIAKIREAGARVLLIGDGDIGAVMATNMPSSEVDVYMGSGGAPEGVLAAVALKCTGGHICGWLLVHSDDELKRAHAAGIHDVSKQYTLDDMVSGDAIFSATGVTDGELLAGVRITGSQISTHSLVMHAGTKTIRKISLTRSLSSFHQN